MQISANTISPGQVKINIEFCRAKQESQSPNYYATKEWAAKNRLLTAIEKKMQKSRNPYLYSTQIQESTKCISFRKTYKN